jgi:hypothetical protein
MLVELNLSIIEIVLCSSLQLDDCHTRFFMPKLSTHRMSQIEYNYYINCISKDYDDSQRNGTVKDSITPQERQPGQHVA